MSGEKNDKELRNLGRINGNNCNQNVSCNYYNTLKSSKMNRIWLEFRQSLKRKCGEKRLWIEYILGMFLYKNQLLK